MLSKLILFVIKWLHNIRHSVRRLCFINCQNEVKLTHIYLRGCKGLRIKIELSVRYLFYVFVIIIIVVVGFPVYWTESLPISHNSNDYKQYKHGQQQ